MNIRILQLLSSACALIKKYITCTDRTSKSIVKKSITSSSFIVILTLAINANATNYCISGNNTTDCSVSGIDITNLTSNIINNGNILGDNPSAAWWSAITNNGGNYTHGIVNNGTITSWVDTIANYSSDGSPNGVVGRITGGITNNSGATISGFHAIVNNNGDWTTPDSNYISSIYNAGSIIGYNQNAGYGSTDQYIGIFNTGTIDTVTNVGSIYVSRNPSISYGIVNFGTITTLNNSQGLGNVNGPLTYTGNLPTNYNIIINSPTSFGRLLVNGGTGTTNFGIHTSSAVANGTYASVLTGLTISNLTATTGAYGTGGWSLSNSSGDIWDLIISGYTFIPLGPSTTDTQASLQASALRLRSTFNAAAISTNFANMNTYDCNLFDTKGLCISAGGRYTTVDNPNSNSTSAVVVVGYKATPNIRIGGFLDQNLSNNTPSGIQVSNKNPLMGIFAVWNQNTDGLGLQVKLANAYQDKEVNTTRDVIGTSEAGIGATNLNTQSYVGELSYAFNYQDKTLLRPYLALRQTTIKQDAYTETGVTTPLSYAALKDRSTTALLGLKLNHKLTPKTTLTASLGLEQDLEHSVDQYSATSAGISGLTAENFNDSIKRTRPVASAGAYYAVSKTQRIAGDVYYQQLPFQSTGGTTAYFNYTIGF